MTKLSAECESGFYSFTMIIAFNKYKLKKAAHLPGSNHEFLTYFVQGKYNLLNIQPE